MGAPERRTSAYSLTNVADSGCPASMRTACSSLGGAATLSEVWLVGLYQYICVLLPKRTLILMYPMPQVQNSRWGALVVSEDRGTAIARTCRTTRWTRSRETPTSDACRGGATGRAG